LQKCCHEGLGEREEEHKKVEKFLELCAAREWLQASNVGYEAVVRLDTEHPEVAEQVYIFNNVASPWTSHVPGIYVHLIILCIYDINVTYAILTNKLFPSRCTTIL
jgi:hypothetical protein